MMALKANAKRLAIVVGIWLTYYMAISETYGLWSYLPRWVRNDLLFSVLSLVSAMLLLLISRRSLLPAAVFFVAGIVFAFTDANLMTVVMLFVAAVIFKSVFKLSRAGKL